MSNLNWQHVAVIAIVVASLVVLAIEKLITGGQALLGIGVITGVGTTLIGINAGATTSLNATTAAQNANNPLDKPRTP